MSRHLPNMPQGWEPTETENQVMDEAAHALLKLAKFVARRTSVTLPIAVIMVLSEKSRSALYDAVRIAMDEERTQ